MEEMYLSMDWVFCLVGLMGLLFYSGRIGVLKKKGIYNPAYGLVVAVIYAVADLFLSLLLYIWFYSEEWGDSDLFIVQEIRVFALMIIVYFLCKLLLPKIDNRCIRKTGSDTNYRLMAVLMAVFCIVDVAITYAVKRYVYGFWYGDPIMSAFYTTVVFAFTAVIAYKVFVSVNRYENIKGLADRTIDGLETRRAPIIFLRSFTLDKKPVSGKTFDEYICSHFAMSMQPIISLSDPDDFLPTGGSIKIQSQDSEWELAIDMLLKNCRAVVFFEGKSDSLQTEMGKIRYFNIPHDKVFVATPPKRYRLAAWNEDNVENKKYIQNYIWKNFATAMESVGGMHGLPMTDPGENRIFTFNERWQATDNPVQKTGTDFFEYILKRTVQYENAQCDYSSLAAQLRVHELQMGITEKENRRIRKSLWLLGILTFLISFVLAWVCKFLSV